MIYRTGLVCLLVFSLILTAAAQEPNCTGLSETDCTLLQNAFENMQQPFHLANFSIDLGGFGGTSTGNNLALSGSGGVTMSEEGLVNGLNLDVTGGMNAENTAGKIIWLDDVLYISRTDETGSETWTGTATDDEGGQLLGDLLSGKLFADTFSQPDVSTVTRLADTEVDGQAMAVFQADVDLVKLLQTEPMLNLLQMVFASAPEDESGMSSMVGQDLAGAVQLLGAFMSTKTVEVILWVGVEDELIYHAELAVDILMNAPSLGESGLTANLVADVDQHGAEVEITAPADYTEQPFDLAGLFGATLGMGGTTEEVDNSVENSIEYGETITATLDSANSRDVWGFTAEAGDVITVTLRALDVTTGLDTVVMLLDENGEELAFNDDHQDDAEGLDVFDSQLANFSIPADGEYRIVATWQSPIRDVAEYELTLETAE